MLKRKKICTNIDEFSDARVVTFLNPYSYMEIFKSKVDLNRFDKICVDGIALKLFLDLACKGSEKIERMSFDFTSVAHFVFDKAVTSKQTGFILGSDEKSNRGFINSVASMFPGINLSGRSGYFGDQNELDEFIKTLSNSSFDFVVIGMGAVKQEQVAIALMDAGFSGRIYTCGGFIHQTALNGGEYYPFLIDKLNLRFIYRMYKEPTTIRRYLLDYPQAFFLLSRNIKAFQD